MTRVGHYVDPSGHSVFAYLKDGYNIDGRLEVTPGTPENIFELYLQSMATIRTGSSDMDVIREAMEVIRKEVWDNNGIATFSMPAGQYNEEYIKWEKKTVDFTKPMELAAISSEDEYWNLPPELRELTVDSMVGEQYDPTGKQVHGWIMDSADDGNLVIYSIDTHFDAEYGNPQSAEEKKFAVRGLQGRIGWRALHSVDFLRRVNSDGSRALWVERRLGRAVTHYVETRARSLFEYIPVPENSTSQ
jgi:hypothetical protein